MAQTMSGRTARGAPALGCLQCPRLNLTVRLEAHRLLRAHSPQHLGAGAQHTCQPSQEQCT